MEIIGAIWIILISTLLLSVICQRLSLPAVIGQILAGVVFGPAVLNWVHQSNWLTVSSEIGVILLMFLAGMESDLKLLQKYAKPAINVAIFGVILPLLLYLGLGAIYHVTLKHAIFWGITFAATSVSITVEVLTEMKRLNSKEGLTILGAAVVDDILALLLLSGFTSFFGVQGASDNLGWLFFWQIMYFIGVFVIIRWCIPTIVHFAQIVTKQAVPATMTITSLLICFGMAYLADVVKLSAVVGAFFAGIAVSQTNIAEPVERNIKPIGYAIFIPIFFFGIGMEIKLNGLQNNLGLIAVLTVVAVISKLYGSAIGAKLAGMSWHSGMIIGAGMVSRGEMALIIAQIGFEAHLVTSGQYADLIFAIVLSTLIAPLLIKYFIGNKRKIL